MLGLSLEIKTLILSQANWVVLAVSIVNCVAHNPPQGEGLGLYRVRPVPSLP